LSIIQTTRRTTIIISIVLYMNIVIVNVHEISTDHQWWIRTSLIMSCLDLNTRHWRWKCLFHLLSRTWSSSIENRPLVMFATAVIRQGYRQCMLRCMFEMFVQWKTWIVFHRDYGRMQIFDSINIDLFLRSLLKTHQLRFKWLFYMKISAIGIVEDSCRVRIHRHICRRWESIERL
jgi:hypothetical protein